MAGEGRPTMDIGIGINSGERLPATSGAITTLATRSSAMPNLRSKSSRSTKNGTRILISQATKDRLTTSIETRLIGEVKVKGRDKSVVICEVKNS